MTRLGLASTLQTSALLGVLLWAVSVVIGAWAAYDTRAAVLRAALLLAALAPVLLSLALRGRRSLPRQDPKPAAIAIISSVLLAVSASIASYYLLAGQWNEGGAMAGVGKAWQALRPKVTLPEDINANVAAGALVVLLPFAVATIIRLARTRRWGLTAAVLLVLLPVGASLALSGSRGAWLGLAAGAAAAGIVWARAVRARVVDRGDARWGVAFATLVFIGIAFAIAAILVLPGLDSVTGSVGGAGGSAISRGNLWRDMLIQARDYAFTGSGIGATMMVDASYVRLLHVGFITHSHNLYLQILLEQGPLGLLGFLLITGSSLAAAAGADGARSFSLAAFAAIVALLVHGIVDTGIYVAVTAPLLFVPSSAALIAATAGRSAKEDGQLQQYSRDSRVSNHPAVPAGRRHVPLAPIAATIALLLAMLPATRAAFLANLAAVSQTREELSRYDWPTWPIQDELRNSAVIDLAPALSLYDGALRLNAADPVANRRLGQINLSLGNYNSAGTNLAFTQRNDYTNRTARRLYAEWLAIEGRTDEAAALWRTVDVSQGQLDARVWWYDHVGEPERAERIRAAAAAVEG